MNKVYEFGNKLKNAYICIVRFFELDDELSLSLLDAYFQDFENCCCDFEKLLKINDMAKVFVNVAQNNPPSNIDDQTVSVPNGGTYTFTASDFQQGYSDPEGDPVWKVKILSLPAVGKLIYNGNAVTSTPLEIPIGDISNGLLQFQDDSGNANGYNTQFDFAVADTGSHQYTS